MSDQKNCKYCHQKPVVESDGYFSEFDNQIMLASGGWTELYIGVTRHGETVMRACGDDYTNDYYPKYCPECGRKLR